MVVLGNIDLLLCRDISSPPESPFAHYKIYFLPMAFYLCSVWVPRTHMTSQGMQKTLTTPRTVLLK